MKTISSESGMKGGGYRVLANTQGNFMVLAYFETPAGMESEIGSGSEPLDAFRTAAENLIGLDVYFDEKKKPSVTEKDGMTEVRLTVGCNGIFYDGTGKSPDGIEAASYLAVRDAVTPITKSLPGIPE